MADRVNHRRLLSMGKVFLDGHKVIDAEKVTITFTPTVKASKAFGDSTEHNRWAGYKIAVEISKFKTDCMAKETVLKYIKDGITPEFTIQGVATDTDSDFYDEFGSETVTCTGCVLTGDLSLLTLDANDEYVKETLKFSAINVN